GNGDFIWISGRSLLTYPISGTGTRAGSPVVRIRQLAAVERKTPATDALGEPALEAFELFDAGVDPLPPPFREPLPVAPPWHTLAGKFVQLGSDLLQGQADPLGEDDEGDPAQDRARVAAVAGAGALGGDQATLFVEAQ